MSLILMTTLFYKALILQGEIWCWSLLRLNFCSWEKKAWEKFSRLSFRNCKSYFYNWDDLLSNWGINFVCAYSYDGGNSSPPSFNQIRWKSSARLLLYRLYPFEKHERFGREGINVRRGRETLIKKPLRKTHQEDAYENSIQSHNSHRVLLVLSYAFKSSIHPHLDRTKPDGRGGEGTRPKVGCRWVAEVLKRWPCSGQKNH